MNYKCLPTEQLQAKFSISFHAKTIYVRNSFSCIRLNVSYLFIRQKLYSMIISKRSDDGEQSRNARLKFNKFHEKYILAGENLVIITL